jgi:sugar lactone lactonase YvrE
MTGFRTTMLAALLSLVGATVSVAWGGTGTSVPGTAGFPESIVIAPRSHTYFVSSFTTGAVFSGTVGGPAHLFLAPGADGRTSATGLWVDRHSRLLVLTGTGNTLQVFTTSSARLQASFGTGVRTGSNLNDLAVTRAGDIYITDFATPRIYRVTAGEIARGRGRIDAWLTPPAKIVPPLADGNLNGIVVSADDRYLLVGQTGNGALYRVDVATRQLRRIRLRGPALTGSDGMLLSGHTLYVACHDNRVVVLALDHAYTRARTIRTITDPTLDFPTSIAAAGNRLLVTNALKPAKANAFTITSLARGSS